MEALVSKDTITRWDVEAEKRTDWEIHMWPRFSGCRE